MQKNKAKILIGSAAAIVLMSTVFGTVAGLAAKTRYRGVNPTQGVVSQLGLIDSVSFKPSVAHFTSDYKTVKQALLGDKTFNASSSEFSDFASKFNFLTNNGRSVLAIPNKYKVVIEKFEAQDEQQRFFLSFHLEETLEDKNVARSATKSIYLSVVDAPKAALAQFSDIVDSNFANLVPSPLSHFSSSSVKPLALTRADDFAKTLNQLDSLEEFESHLSKFFDIQAIKAKIRLEAQGFGFAKGDLEEPFVFSFVKNPQNTNEWATSLNQQVPAVRLYLKTEFGSQAKATLADYKHKDDSLLTSIDLVASDKSTLFANTNDLAAQLDVNLLDASDYYIDPDKPQVDPTTGVLLPSQLSLFDRDLLRQPSNKPVDKFSLFRYDAINFYKQLQELVSKPSAIKDIIDASLTRGLTFSFGKYDLLFDNLREHLDYDFLVSNAKIRQNSVSKKLFIELPIKIKLKSSILGDSGPNIKTILEKTVSFKLDNFRDQSIEDALASLYPELSQQLKDLKDAQTTQDAAQQLAATSPIQSQWAGQTLGATKENPYDIVQGAPKSYLLSKYEIKQLIDQKDYKKLISLLADQNSYNIYFKLGSTLQSQNIQVPTETEIANLNATIDSAQALKNANIYSVSTSAFKNRASLFAYFRYLLSLEPKEAIKKLVNIGSQMGLEFEGYQDLPLNPTLADLAKVKIKTKFDNYEHSRDFLSEQDADENQDDSVGTKFGLKLLDFNGYFANDITSPNQGMALFLPASLDSSSVQSTGGGSGSTNPTPTTDWKDEITKKLVSDKNQLASLPFAIWDRIIGQEKAQDNTQKLTYKILKNYQDAIKIAKQPAFWNTVDTDNNPQVPFKDQNFSKIATLSDLVFAFYTQAALANNWNEYQDSGARPSIKFEIEEDTGASKDQGNIIGLKIKYVVGFDDNAGSFVDDVISSTPQTIFVRTSGKSEAEVKQKNNLDQMIEDAPLSSQSLILDAEKFGHLQILANSIYDKKKPAPEPETPRQDSGIRWIDDKVPGQPRPEVKRPEINQDEFFKGKLRPVAVEVSTFSALDESPYFATPFQDSPQTSPAPDSTSQSSNEDLQTLKQKLEILLGEQFSNYFNNLDPNITFEIESVKEISPEVYSVSLSLVKNVVDGNTTTRVKSDKSLTLIVHKQQDNIPELAKTPEVSNTSWAKQYNPDNPLANSTTITLEFKNPIQTDASGQPTSQWLSSVPVSIHPAELALSPLQPVIAPTVKNDGLAKLSGPYVYFNASKTSDINSKKVAAQKATREASTIKVEDPNLITSSPVLIPNPQHQLVQLTLNPLLNQSVVDFKISDLKVESATKLSFTLESSDIKRLINAPIEIAKASSNDTSETQGTTNIVKIKPKLILQGAIGVPWATVKKPARDLKFLKTDIDKLFFSRVPQWAKTQFDIKKRRFSNLTNNQNVDPQQAGSNWHGFYLNNNDPLANLFTTDPAQDLSALSLKVFDPSGYLNQRLAKEGQEGKTPTTNLNLYSYQLNKTKEDKVRKGWTNVHPNQFVSPGENFKLTNDYLNIILNQPTKVTYYSASDFVNNLFNDPDKKPEEIQDKYTKTVKEKVGANAVDWGTAYLNFWYPKELIQQQSNIISANLTDLLFVNPDELTNNEKMIAPNLINWWPNFRNSETPFIRTTENTQAKSSVLQNPLGWTQVQDGGFGLRVRKTLFNRDTRTFTLTTNIPVPTQDYSEVKDTDDWRFVFQNESGQIAMLKATRTTKDSNNPDFKDNGAVQFQTVIPEHFFSSNVRFVGIFKQEDQKLQWLPIADTEFIIDDRYFNNITSDTLDFKNANARGLTNNAFGEIFKEFNIHKPRK
ncbi:P97 family adhesin [Mesomycoplasma ovipneumoniae]|uniref:P97 family adhesin n=1 Tax=Mesomycoplasma ovipneumoniae TaxID=29562 RepID=UPI003080C9B7